MEEGNEDSLHKNNKGYLSLYVAGESATSLGRLKGRQGRGKALQQEKRQTSVGSDWLLVAQGSYN